ncbi:acyl--CoA ligase [Photobacterium sagamiensis]|uniref:class I adenylate-forming enzyme family protein n=1 Tax=Photobacterium sagamiensis TaxID=2910241 RepID=UPI003D0FF316
MFSKKPHRLLSDSLKYSTLSSPDKVAVIVNEMSYTYQQLLEASQRLAVSLLTSGIKRNDRVVLYMDNTWACVVSIYAVQLCGAAFVVVNPQIKTKKLLYILKDSAATALISESTLQKIFLPALSETTNLKAVICSGELKANDEPSSVLLSFETIVSQPADLDMLENEQPITLDLAALIYTSGSTGDPKGVMQSHQSMVFVMESISESLRLSNKDRNLSVLPLSYGYGLYQLLTTIYMGATLILERSFSYPAQIFEKFHNYQITVFAGVPTIYSMINEAHGRSPLLFPNVKRVTNAAAALPDEFIPIIQDVFPNALIYKMYGLTECQRGCYLEPELIDKKPTSVGKAIPGTEMFLLSQEGERLEKGKKGKGILHVRGPHVMLGYWNKPEKTKEVIKPGRFVGDRVLCTQDLFYQDEEGFFYFVGRSDDIIQTRGEKVSPAEIENILHSMAGIKDAAVVGVQDKLLGEFIRAFVSLKKDAVLEIHHIKKYCMENLENYMMPKEIIILPELAKSTNGKIDKKVLKRWSNK